jgi:alkanesulfonate monooxygenase SsuD/methylene tetrahydromethanopterin reductase-like flavin-dependent oxidoreductase (luciferase family)
VTVRFGVVVSNFGSQSDPRAALDLATAAEEAGWEGLFIWDHLAFVWGMPSADPWVVLTACAMTTSRILLGTAVTPVPRRRVQNVAHTVATLDRLSGGRVVFGAGLGGNRGEFERFGEDYSRERRIALLDEGLATLRRWWDGQEVGGIALRPPPTGRVPIWIGGNSDDALARAARYDGWLPDSAGFDDTMAMTPEEVRQGASRVDGDVAVAGFATAADPRDYEAAGATWWLECVQDRRGSPEEMLAIVRAGPPA